MNICTQKSRIVSPQKKVLFQVPIFHGLWDLTEHFFLAGYNPGKFFQLCQPILRVRKHHALRRIPADCTYDGMGHIHLLKIGHLILCQGHIKGSHRIGKVGFLRRADNRRGHALPPLPCKGDLGHFTAMSVGKLCNALHNDLILLFHAVILSLLSSSKFQSCMVSALPKLIQPHTALILHAQLFIFHSITPSLPRTLSPRKQTIPSRQSQYFHSNIVPHHRLFRQQHSFCSYHIEKNTDIYYNRSEQREDSPRRGTSGTEVFMSITIQSKNNYSFLFQSLGSSKGGVASNLNFLSDYASIKNGSYAKLMKAYYGKNNNDAVSSVAEKTKTTDKVSDTAKTLAKVQTSTDSLKESADALLKTGSKSVFKDDEVTEDAYKAVSAFVKDYNSVLDATQDVNSTSVLRRTLILTKETSNNEKLLSQVGITILKDNSLSIDKEAFMKADAATVKSLFQGTGSYAYRVSAQSSLINFAADREAASASPYTSSGDYNRNYNTGNIFNGFF